MITDQLANEMLGKIEDPSARDRYAAILNRTATRKVRCGQCNETIAFIKDGDGQPTEVTEVPVGDRGPGGVPKKGLAGHRIRMDGSVGYQCWCGNDERLLPEEKGIVSDRPPSAEEVKTVLTRIDARTKVIGSRFIIESAV